MPEPSGDCETPDKMETIWIPSSMKQELKEEKIIDREPFYRVIRRLIDYKNDKPF